MRSMMIATDQGHCGCSIKFGECVSEQMGEWTRECKSIVAQATGIEAGVCSTG